MKQDNRNSASYKVCSECGITHSPLWRGGPLGPKTMCNACGIRWKRANQAHHKSNKMVVDTHYIDNPYNPKNSKIVHDGYEEDYDEGYDSEDSDVNEKLKLTPEGHRVRYAPNSDLIINELCMSPFELEPKKQSRSSRKKSKTQRKLFNANGTKSKPYSRKSNNSISKTSTEFHVNCPECQNEAELSLMLLQQAAEEYDRLEHELPIDEKMEQLYHEVLELRQEVEKKDAVINQLKSTDPQIPQQALKLLQPTRERSMEGERSSSSSSPSESPGDSPNKSTMDGKNQRNSNGFFAPMAKA